MAVCHLWRSVTCGGLSPVAVDVAGVAAKLNSPVVPAAAGAGWPNVKPTNNGLARHGL